MPRAAVKLPSLPPPTATPVGLGRPASAATFWARANSSAVACSGIGGRLTPPATSSRASGSNGASAAIAASTRAASSSSLTRTSTRIVASAGTTLSAVPALATVGVTVVPRAGSASSEIASTWRAASIERVHPLLRLQPGMGGPAVDGHVEAAGPLATDLQRTTVGGRLEDEHGPTGLGARLDEGTRGAGADLLVGREQQLDARPVGERGDGVHAEHDPALHVEHAGPGGVAIVDAERAGRQRAEREDGVVVPDEQHPRLATATPVDVRPGRARDELGRRAEPALDQLRDRGRGALDGVDLQRRRLDLDQGLADRRASRRDRTPFAHGSDPG